MTRWHQIVMLGDVNGHHPAWDVSCYNPDRVGQLIYDWTSQQDWQVLNTGAPTRSGYGEEAQFSAQTSRWPIATWLGDAHGRPAPTSAAIIWYRSSLLLSPAAARGESGRSGGPSARPTGLASQLPVRRRQLTFSRRTLW